MMAGNFENDRYAIAQIVVMVVWMYAPNSWFLYVIIFQLSGLKKGKKLLKKNKNSLLDKQLGYTCTDKI